MAWCGVGWREVGYDTEKGALLDGFQTQAAHLLPMLPVAVAKAGSDLCCAVTCVADASAVHAYAFFHYNARLV